MALADKKVFVLRGVDQRSLAAQFVSELPVDAKKPMMVVISDYEQKRSDLQNKYLWGWLYRNIAEQLEAAGIVIDSEDGREYPYDKDLLHEIFRERYLCYATIRRSGKERKLCYSTTELLRSPKEGQEQRCFGTYVTSIKQFVYQLWQIHIPPTYNEELQMLESEIYK